MSQNPSLQRVGILWHPHKPESQTIAQAIGQAFEKREITAWVHDSHAAEAVRAEVPRLDLLVVLGGDGSMLRAARMTAGHNTPLLGINMGRIGFLSEWMPDDWRDSLDQLVAGQYWLEERIMLRAEAWRGDDMLGRHLALNDIVVKGGSLARAVHLDTYIDGDFLTKYIADGLIVATPTGSTAYALAVGGPILPPELHNYLVVPIAAHLSLNRAIVLAEGSQVGVQVATDHEAILTVDGQYEEELQDRDRVEVYSSQHTSHFVRFGKRSDFYKTLLDRLAPRPDEDKDRE